MILLKQYILSFILHFKRKKLPFLFSSIFLYSTISDETVSAKAELLCMFNHCDCRRPWEFAIKGIDSVIIIAGKLGQWCLVPGVLVLEPKGIKQRGMWKRQDLPQLIHIRILKRS